MSQPAFDLKRASDSLPVDIVLRLSADGKAVSVEDNLGNKLDRLLPTDISGAVQSLETATLITTKVNPTCFWICIGGYCYKVCY